MYIPQCEVLASASSRAHMLPPPQQDRAGEGGNRQNRKNRSEKSGGSK